MISTEYIMFTKIMYPCIRKSLKHWLAGKKPLPTCIPSENFLIIPCLGANNVDGDLQGT